MKNPVRVGDAAYAVYREGQITAVDDEFVEFDGSEWRHWTCCMYEASVILRAVKQAVTESGRKSE